MLIISTKVMNKFVDNVLVKDKSIIIGSQSESAFDTPSFPINGINADNVLSNIYSIILSSNNINKIPFGFSLALKKSLEWIDLFKKIS